MISVRTLMFKVGSFILCVCSVLLGFAVLAELMIDRQLSPVETWVALVAGLVIGSVWWAFVLRRMRSRGADV